VTRLERGDRSILMTFQFYLNIQITLFYRASTKISIFCGILRKERVNNCVLNCRTIFGAEFALLSIPANGLVLGPGNSTFMVLPLTGNTRERTTSLYSTHQNLRLATGDL
jgi:hypothetical protein